MAEFSEEQFKRWALSDDPRVTALVAEVRRLRSEMLKALRESGCNGDLCAHQWHETFREILGEERFQ